MADSRGVSGRFDKLFSEHRVSIVDVLIGKYLWFITRGVLLGDELQEVETSD